MTLSRDEQVVRLALHDFAADQPEAPHTRVDGVRRRHVQRRRRQAVVASVAAVAMGLGVLTGIGALRVGGAGKAEPAKRPVPSWALAWPERRDASIPQGTLDAAVAAWRQRFGIPNDSFYAPRQVIWYVAEKADSGDSVVVTFEVETDAGDRRLVVGTANASEVLQGQPGVTADGISPWTLYDVAAPSPAANVVLGLNLMGGPPSGSGAMGDNIVVVIADPSARTVRWRVTSADQQLRTGEARLAGGYGEFDAGQVRTPVRIVDVRTGGGHVLARDEIVGVPGAPDSQAPELAAVPSFPDLPKTANVLGEDSGQGTLGFVTPSVPRLGLTQIFARCYGGASIRVSIDADRPGQTVTVPCDDVEHVLTGPRLLVHSDLPDAGHGYDVTASQSTAWRVAVVVT